MKKLLIATLFFLILANLFALEINEIYFKFQIHSKKELAKLSKIISIDNVKGNTVYAYANKKEMAKFKSLGYKYTKLQNPSLAFKPKMAFSKDEMRDWDSYPTYDTYVDMMYNFEETYPNICSVQSMGTSVQGREILFAKISDNVDVDEDEPTFFYTAQMHGDEIVTYIMMLHLIDYLCSNYQSDSYVTNLVNSMQIWINPLSNPDGTYHGGNNTVWGAQRYNGNGVDLNRNFPDPDDGDHPDGNEYQPETIIMMNFANQHNIVMSANFHSGSELVNYPWDTWQRLHPDNDWFYYVSREYADLAQQNSPDGYMDDMNNGVTNGYAWYPISGGRQDFMNYFHHCKEVTIELSLQKLLPEDQLVAHWNYNRDSFLTYMEEALYGLRGHITDANGNPLKAKVLLVDHDSDNSWVYSDSTYGAFYRPINEGIYTLQVSKEGYITQTIPNVVVTNHQATEVNITLNTASVVNVTGTITDADTQQPIQGATVTLLETSLEPATTNENGEYTIQNVPEGNYTFSIMATGYTPFVQIENVTQQNHEFNFQLHISTAESFEGNTFPPNWSFEGDADWTIASDEFYDGLHSAKSGDVDDGQFSSLVYTTTITEDGQISFYYKVSSEAGYDFLNFYIDGVQTGSWSGEVSWTQASYDIATGSHVFKWEYVKDTSVSQGQDCAWIDMVDLPAHGWSNLEVSPNSFDISLTQDSIYTDTLFISNTGTAPLNFTVSILNDKSSKSKTDRDISGSYLECEEESFYTGTPITLHFTVHAASNDGEWIKYIYLTFPSDFNIDQTSITDFSVNGGNTLPFSTIGTNIVTWGNGTNHLEDGDVAEASLTFSALQLYTDNAEITYRLVGDNWGTGVHQISDSFTLINNGPILTWLTLSQYSGQLNPQQTQAVAVTFNTNNLDLGDYQATIDVFDDSDHNITIPVNLSVQEANSNNDDIVLAKPFIKNYPNPFNPTTTLHFSINNKNIDKTQINIYNLKGQLVKTIETFTKGDNNTYFAKWNGVDKNGKKSPSGIYLYRLKNGNKTLCIGKMLMLK